MASAWGAAWSVFWGNSWGATGDVTPPPASPSTGGGGARVNWQNPRLRKAYEQYAARLLKRREESDSADADALEIAWNRAHGIEAPEVVTVPQPIAEVVQRINTLPPRRMAERDDLMDRLVDMIGEFRRQLAAEIAAQQEAARRAALAEEEAIIALLLA